MKAALILRDLKALTRDPLSGFIALLTLGISLLFRYLLPWGAGLFPPLEPYIPSIHFFVLLLTPFMLGWVGGFLYLDDREEGVLPLFAVSPLGPHWVLFCKSILALILGFILLPLQWLILGGSHLDSFSLWGFFLLMACQGPWVQLSLCLLASNRLQGLTLGKVLSLIVFIPLVDLFLPYPWSLLGRLVPGGWLKILLFSIQDGSTLEPSILFMSAFETLLFTGILLFIYGRRKSLTE